METLLTFVDKPMYVRDIQQMTDDFNEFCIESENESIDEQKDYSYCVLAIDIGILHLGISVTLLDEEYNFLRIIWIDLINITKFVHKKVSENECKLNHTKTFCDWLNHTFQENTYFFGMADFILVERQPPVGFVVIEQLIFSKFREKAILISPNSMHSYFNIGNYEYEQRKVYTEKIARMNITNPEILAKIGVFERFHDIADSICIMLFWINKKHKELQQEKRQQLIKDMKMNINISGGEMHMDKWFEMYRYIPTD